MADNLEPLEMLFNQVCPGVAWFLEIDLVHEMYVYVCVCVSTPKASNNYWYDVM